MAHLSTPLQEGLLYESLPCRARPVGKYIKFFAILMGLSLAALLSSVSYPAGPASTVALFGTQTSAATVAWLGMRPSAAQQFLLPARVSHRQPVLPAPSRFGHRSMQSVARAESDAAAMSFTVDSHVTIVPYFTVPDGKMDEFKAGFSDFYEGTKSGTKDCLYYGFCTSGNQVFCREGYKNAEGVLAHLSDVKDPLDKAVGIVGEGGLKLAVMGPAAELEKLKEPMGGLGTVFWETDKGSMWFSQDSASSPDTHVTIVPYFTVPDEKMDEFKAGFSDFYEGTKTGTKDCLYYGFCSSGNQVFCREGYKNAEGVLAHLGDVKGPLDKAVGIVGEGGLKLAVMGPAAELDKLKEPMGGLGTVFWELDSGSRWMPASR